MSDHNTRWRCGILRLRGFDDRSCRVSMLRTVQAPSVREAVLRYISGTLGDRSWEMVAVRPHGSREPWQRWEVVCCGDDYVATRTT